MRLLVKDMLNLVTLEDEDGEEGTFEVDVAWCTQNGNEYAILVPLGSDGDEETDKDEGVLVRLEDGDDGLYFVAVNDEIEARYAMKMYETLFEEDGYAN